MLSTSSDYTPRTGSVSAHIRMSRMHAVAQKECEMIQTSKLDIQILALVNSAAFTRGQ